MNTQELLHKYAAGERNFEGENLVRIAVPGADLAGIKLSRANLAGANLSRANLSNADFREANLARVNFTEANLTNALFLKANLTEAQLSCATLKGAIRSVPVGHKAFRPYGVVNRLAQICFTKLCDCRLSLNNSYKRR